MDVCLLARPGRHYTCHHAIVPKEIGRESENHSHLNINSFFYYNMYHIVQFYGGGPQVLHDLLV